MPGRVGVAGSAMSVSGVIERFLAHSAVIRSSNERHDIIVIIVRAVPARQERMPAGQEPWEMGTSALFFRGISRNM